MVSGGLVRGEAKPLLHDVFAQAAEARPVVMAQTMGRRPTFCWTTLSVRMSLGVEKRARLQGTARAGPA